MRIGYVLMPPRYCFVRLSYLILLPELAVFWQIVMTERHESAAAFQGYLQNCAWRAACQPDQERAHDDNSRELKAQKLPVKADEGELMLQDHQRKLVT